jgi:aspartate/methionine/tyrosine aminotransferase
MMVSVLADRVKNLGGENAFLVAAEARKLTDAGRIVYPFHLGDFGCSEPENIQNACDLAHKEGKTGYCNKSGIEPLKEAVAEYSGKRRNLTITPDMVSITAGGKPVIAFTLLALMNPGDRVCYPNPGYPIYESWINYLGGVPVPYSYKETSDGFKIDLEQLVDSIDREKPKVVVINNYQNPTASVLSPEEMQAIADICIMNNAFVLSDEAYEEIRYDNTPFRSIASLPGMQERTMILFSFSKTWAMTGERVGAGIGPKPEGPQSVIGHLNELNVNVYSCVNQSAQWAALEAITGNQDGARNILARLKASRDATYGALSNLRDVGVVVHLPPSTFYQWADVTEPMRRMGIADYDAFWKKVLSDTGVAFCPRSHFGKPLPGEERKYARFSFSGITPEDSVKGIEKLGEYLRRF